MTVRRTGAASHFIHGATVRLPGTERPKRPGRWHGPDDPACAIPARSGDERNGIARPVPRLERRGQQGRDRPLRGGAPGGAAETVSRSHLRETFRTVPAGRGRELRFASEIVSPTRFAKPERIENGFARARSGNTFGRSSGGLRPHARGDRPKLFPERRFRETSAATPRERPFRGQRVPRPEADARLAPASAGAAAATSPYSAEQVELPHRPQRPGVDAPLTKRLRQLLGESVVGQHLGGTRRPRVGQQPLEVRMVRERKRLVRPVPSRSAGVDRPSGEDGRLPAATAGAAARTSRRAAGTPPPRPGATSRRSGAPPRPRRRASGTPRPLRRPTRGPRRCARARSAPG